MIDHSTTPFYSLMGRNVRMAAGLALLTLFASSIILASTGWRTLIDLPFSVVSGGRDSGPLAEFVSAKAMTAHGETAALNVPRWHVALATIVADQFQ